MPNVRRPVPCAHCGRPIGDAELAAEHGMRYYHFDTVGGNRNSCFNLAAREGKLDAQKGEIAVVASMGKLAAGIERNPVPTRSTSLRAKLAALAKKLLRR